jgi:AraC-like DNA-binding protein
MLSMAEVRCLFAFEHKVFAGKGGGRHRHPCTEIVVARGGRGVLIHDRTRYAFGPGDVLIYQPGPEHQVEQTRTGWHLCLGVIGCGAAEIPPGVLNSNAATGEICARIRKALSSNAVGRSTSVELLTGLLVLQLQSSRGKAAPRSKSAQVRDLIDAGYARRWTLPKLAAAVFVSPDYLRQLFRQEFGVPPMRYLLTRRIEVARTLLGMSDAPLREIAACCGFDDVFYFSRAFKKVMGLPPSEYRTRYAFKVATKQRV